MTQHQNSCTFLANSMCFLISHQETWLIWYPLRLHWQSMSVLFFGASLGGNTVYIYIYTYLSLFLSLSIYNIYVYLCIVDKYEYKTFTYICICIFIQFVIYKKIYILDPAVFFCHQDVQCVFMGAFCRKKR